MFKILSKHRYEELKSAPADMKERFDRYYNAAAEKIQLLEAEVKKLNEENSEMAERACWRDLEHDRLVKECDKHKSLYADELYKRVKLAEKVRDLEEHIAKVENLLHKAEADFRELQNSLPQKSKEVQRRTVGRILHILHTGVPQYDGTLNKDREVLIDFIAKEFNYCE